MARERFLGVLVGLITAALGWLRAMGSPAAEGHPLALLADVLTLLAIPAALALCIFHLRRRRPDQDGAELQRRALWIVLWASPLYGVVFAVKAMIEFSHATTAAFMAAFFLSGIVMMIIGTLSVMIGARVIARSPRLAGDARGASPRVMLLVVLGGVLALYLITAGANLFEGRRAMPWTEENAASTFPPGSRFPEIALRRLDGSSARIAEFAGRPVLVNFWRTWCGPCVAEMPELDALERSGDAVVLGVSSEPAELQSKFRRDSKIAHELLVCDEKESEVLVGGFPTSVLVGPDGAVIASWVGAIRADDVRRRVASRRG